MTSTITPFLMFQGGKAQEALDFYVGLFDDASITSISHYDANGRGPEGTVELATFTIGGRELMCIDSPIEHAFGFTPSLSFWVACKTEVQFDRYFAALSVEGAVMMPPGNYGFSEKFAWVADRFGVTWQLNLD